MAGDGGERIPAKVVGAPKRQGPAGVHPTRRPAPAARPKPRGAGSLLIAPVLVVVVAASAALACWHTWPSSKASCRSICHMPEPLRRRWSFWCRRCRPIGNGHAQIRRRGCSGKTRLTLGTCRACNPSSCRNRQLPTGTIRQLKTV